MFKIWNFIGVERNSKTEADKIIDNIFLLFFEAINNFLNKSYKEYSSFDYMIEEAIESKAEYNYFWSWLHDYGLKKIKKVGEISIEDSDDLLDYLEYRLYLLEEDIENSITTSIITGLVETVNEIHKNFCEVAYAIDYWYENMISFESNYHCIENPADNQRDYLI